MVGHEQCSPGSRTCGDDPEVPHRRSPERIAAGVERPSSGRLVSPVRRDGRSAKPYSNARKGSQHTANHPQAATVMMVAHIYAMAALSAPWMQALVTHCAASSWLASQGRLCCDSSE